MSVVVSYNNPSYWGNACFQDAFTTVEEIALYGTAIKGEKGEAHFLPKIDFNEPRHVPFLPYELLVVDGKVISLHGKYRIALSFPDLKMGTFMKIMSTPADIAKAQASLLAN